VVLPFGATAKPIEVNGEGIPFTMAFERFDRQISTAILHQTLATQESQHETRAAAQVHQDVLALLVRIGKRTLAAMLKQDVFYPLVKYNWGEQAARNFTPSANLSEVEAEDISPRMVAVSQLAAQGLVFPSQLPDLFADLDLPPASAEDLAHYAEEFTAPPPSAQPPNATGGTEGEVAEGRAPAQPASQAGAA
jgi:phage gp29-like protein